MKIRIRSIFVSALLFVACVATIESAKGDVSSEIKETIQRYFDATSARDVPAIQAVLGETFVAIDTIVEQGNKNARVRFIDSSKGNELLPPEGNDDVAGLRVTSLTMEIAPSNSTVASVSFVATKPMPDKALKAVQMWLSMDADTVQKLQEIEPDEYEAERVRMEKLVAERQLHFSFLAMLVLQDGNWKIVSMSFPG